MDVWRWQDTSCSARGDQPSCESTSDCVFDTNTNLCVNKCNSKPDSGACGAESGCEYDTATNTCVEKCSDKSFTACMAASECSFDTNTNTCVDTCSSLTDPAACNLQSGCVYASGQCVDKCNSQSSGTGCNAVPGCGYDVNTGTCVDQPDPVCPLACYYCLLGLG